MKTLSLNTSKRTPSPIGMRVVPIWYCHLKVYGVNGLRGMDCSVIPVLPDVNIQGPVFMIGEKGAQMIGEDWNF